MKKFLMGSAVACGAILAFAAVNTASAGNIAVANASFETLPGSGLPYGCGAGCSYSYSGDAPTNIPGWTGAGLYGQWQLGSYPALNYVPDGPTVAFTNGGSISQTVGATAIAGLTYTLDVDVGFRKDVPDNSLIELVVGSNVVDATGVSNQASGNWYDWTASYTALAGDAGDAISIVLACTGPQCDWDDVRLTSSASAVPEPGTFAVFGLALLALGGLGLRRKFV